MKLSIAECSHTETFVNTRRLLLMGRLKIVFVTSWWRADRNQVLVTFVGAECNLDHYLVVAKLGIDRQ